MRTGAVTHRRTHGFTSGLCSNAFALSIALEFDCPVMYALEFDCPVMYALGLAFAFYSSAIAFALAFDSYAFF